MVRYDSSTSTLHFLHVLGREGAEPFKSTDLEICLAEIPENIRQLLIQTAKLSSAHASEQKLLAGKNDTTKEGKSLLFVGDRLKKLVEQFALQDKGVKEKKTVVESKAQIVIVTAQAS